MAELWAPAVTVAEARKHIYDLSAPTSFPNDDFPLSQEDIYAAMAAVELAAATLEDGELLGAVKTAAATPTLYGAVPLVPSGATTANATPRSELGSVLPESIDPQDGVTEEDEEDGSEDAQHRKTRRGRRGGKKTQARREKAIAEGRPAHKPRHRQEKEGQSTDQF